METPAPDYILVPLGFIIIAGYHAWLLRRIIHHPTKPIAGIHSVSRQIPVRTVMEGKAENGAQAVQTLRNRITATALMARAAIMLGSSIAIMMANAHCLEQNPEMMLSRAGITVKFLCLAAYLLAAFLLSMQTGRYYSRAGMLITSLARCRAKEYVAGAVNGRSCFRATGLRACYLAVPLYLWIFGSIQMVAGSIAMVVIMYFLDTQSDWDEAEEMKKAGPEETVVKADMNAAPQFVSRHDREISSVELLEIIVVKDWDEGEEKKKAAREEPVKVDMNAAPQFVSRHDREISSVELLEIIVVKD